MITPLELEQAQPDFDVSIQRWFIQTQRPNGLWGDAPLDVNRRGGFRTLVSAEEYLEHLERSSFYDKGVSMRIVKRSATLVTTVEK